MTINATTTTTDVQNNLEWCREECRNEYMRRHNGEYPPCGCGSGHKMKPFGEQIVHWRGAHWVLDCLTEHLLRERTNDHKVIALLTARMKKFQADIAGLKCATPTCNNRVGKSYRLLGDAVYCQHCFFDHGGEA